MPTFCAPCPGQSQIVLTTHDQAAPGEACAEGAQHHDHAGLQAAGLDGLVERDRDGRRRCVAEAVHVDVDLVHRHAGVLRGRFDDADVGLVGNQQIDITSRHAGAL